jgi:Asp-tRNA(Asn)/Glu-tRNA(Gln) amidotransferase A subunit family amidase
VRPRELVADATEVIERHNRALSAAVMTCFAAALALAEADHVRPEQPLAGIPLLSKDHAPAGRAFATGNQD